MDVFQCMKCFGLAAGLIFPKNLQNHIHIYQNLGESYVTKLFFRLKIKAMFGQKKH